MTAEAEFFKPLEVEVGPSDDGLALANRSPRLPREGFL